MPFHTLKCCQEVPLLSLRSFPAAPKDSCTIIFQVRFCSSLWCFLPIKKCIAEAMHRKTHGSDLFLHHKSYHTIQACVIEPAFLPKAKSTLECKIFNLWCNIILSQELRFVNSNLSLFLDDTNKAPSVTAFAVPPSLPEGGLLCPKIRIYATRVTGGHGDPPPRGFYDLQAKRNKTTTTL